jgi:hypothetical protein
MITAVSSGMLREQLASTSSARAGSATTTSATLDAAAAHEFRSHSGRTGHFGEKKAGEVHRQEG